MAGFLSKTISLSVFWVADPAVVTLDSLKKHAFNSIDTLKNEVLSMGCTSLEDMSDTKWLLSPEKGEWFCFCLRVDKRTLPNAVFKKHFADALKEEEHKLVAEGQGAQSISRLRKRELRDQIKSKLLANIEPAPKIADVALNMHTGMLLITSTGQGMLTYLENILANMGVTIKRVEPQVDVPQGMLALYSDSLAADHNGHGYTLIDGGKMTLAGGSADDEEIEVSVKHDRASADAGIAAGLSITKIKVKMERDSEPGFAWTFVLDSSLSFSGLKTPATEGSTDDMEAALLEKLYLLELAVGVVHKLFDVREPD